MTKTKITPAIIVERFLPQYEERMDSYCEGMSPFGINTYAAHRKAFFEDNFQEALENLLMEQKLIICDEAHVNHIDYCLHEIDAESVINATSPLEEL